MQKVPVVILGDLHFPFHHKKALARALGLIKLIKPKVVVQVGDLYDLYSFSKFPRSLNVITPSQEIKRGRKFADDMWSYIRDAVGKEASLYQLLGNHDERLAKRIVEALPEVEGFTSSGLWEFEGVETMGAEREELILDGVLYMHGYRRHGDHVKYNLMSTVCGHTHLGGVVFHPIKGKPLFELNAGYLGDPYAHALSYSKQSKISKWTLGMGVIDQYGPRFIPL